MWQPVVMIRDRAETEADFGTFPPQGSLCLSGVSNWLPKRRGPVGSLGDECLAPVLLLRILILRRFDTTTSATDIIGLKHTCSISHIEACVKRDAVQKNLHHPWTGRSGASSPGCGCWSLPEDWCSFQTGRSWRRPEEEGYKQPKTRWGKWTHFDDFPEVTLDFLYLAMRPVCLWSQLPSAGAGEGLSPPVSPRSSLSSLWLRSDEKLKLDGVARCSVLL